MCEAGAGARTDDTAIISVTFHKGRKSVPIGKYTFETRKGAIVAAAIDRYIRDILESKCPNPDE